jgi:hypothetical protein
MNYFLIKPLNCIVSDAEIQEGDKVYQNNYEKTNPQIIIIESSTQAKIANEKGGSYLKMKIEYSNNLEGIKPFELVDEVEELARSIYRTSSDSDYNSILSMCKVEGFIAGYKAKAGGYTESQMIGFADYLLMNFEQSFQSDKGWVWLYWEKHTQNKKYFTTSELLTLYLQEQESRMIEVIQISENTFKIK